MTGTGLVGILGNFGDGELVVILIVALVFLGPDRLPEMAKGAGRLLHKVKTMTEGIQGEVRQVMDDPSMKPLRELGEIAARPRAKLTEYALEAEAEARANRERDVLDGNSAENAELAGKRVPANGAAPFPDDDAADNDSTGNAPSVEPHRDRDGAVAAGTAGVAANGSASPAAIDGATRKEAAAKLARLTMNTEAARRASSAAPSAVAEITAEEEGSGPPEATATADDTTPIDLEQGEQGPT